MATEARDSAILRLFDQDPGLAPHHGGLFEWSGAFWFKLDDKHRTPTEMPKYRPAFKYSEDDVLKVCGVYSSLDETGYFGRDKVYRSWKHLIQAGEVVVAVAERIRPFSPSREKFFEYVERWDKAGEDLEDKYEIGVEYESFHFDRTTAVEPASYKDLVPNPDWTAGVVDGWEQLKRPVEVQSRMGALVYALNEYFPGQVTPINRVGRRTSYKYELDEYQTDRLYEFVENNLRLMDRDLRKLRNPKNQTHISLALAS